MGGHSRGDAVVQVDDSAARALLIEELKIETPMPGKGGFAASQDQGPEEQVTLVHQSRRKRLGSEISSANREVVRFDR